jgi:DNA-binding MarR family transcriptional regulator
MESLGLDLTGEQWGVLVKLWNNGDLAQEEILRQSCIEKSTLTRILDRMEKKDLISRRTKPEDSRRKILSLTDKAESRKQDILKAVKKTLARALKGVERQEVDICLKVLEQVKKNLAEPGESLKISKAKKNRPLRLKFLSSGIVLESLIID